MKAITRTLQLISLSFLAVMSLGDCASADIGRATASVCAPEHAPPNDTLLCGHLENGLRYVIQKNVSPPGTASIWLVITAGSMQEADDQHGVAHFLEHMAFRGSTHVADGEMMRTLQRLGARFG